MNNSEINKEEITRHVMTFYIDTNRINAKSNETNMNILEKMKECHVIRLLLPMQVNREIMNQVSASVNAETRKKKASNYIYSKECLSISERETYKRIRKIIFPNEKMDKRKWADVRIVFTALKNQCPLITNDGDSKKQPGGILGHRDELMKELGAQIIRDYEAVELVKKAIIERDKRIISFHNHESDRYPLYDWVGKDLELLEG